MENSDKLIFVYNADAGLFDQLTDFAHKIISPGTYSCNLCKLTYGNLSIKKGWKEFLDSLDVEKVFLHRNEFSSLYPELADTALPAIFLLETGKEAVLLFSAAGINQIESLQDLQNLLKEKIGKKSA